MKLVFLQSLFESNDYEPDLDYYPKGNIFHVFSRSGKQEMPYSNELRFIHFTTKERANEILKSRKLLRTPEGIVNSGPSNIYAISVDFGVFAPLVQLTHIKKKSWNDIVAVKFTTNVPPDVIFPEEAVWRKDNIKLNSADIISLKEAISLITKNNPDKPKLSDRHQQYIIFI